MARPLRIEYAGGVYHITSRGNQRASIFLDDADRRQWLQIVEQIADRFGWRIFAYCQMGNHYHLVAQTAQANLARCMRHLNGIYTQRFNRHHCRCGHLLQGRYHAVIVDKQSYLLELVRYVVLNPVRAGMVRHASQWAWSSYRATAGEAIAPEWLAASEVLEDFASKPSVARRAFRRFVAAGLSARSPWDDVRQEIYLGDDEFVARAQTRMNDARASDAEIPRSQRLRKSTSLSEIFSSAEDVPSAVVLAYRSGYFTMRQIADHLGVHYSTVSRILARGEKLDCKT